jgi:hypothetical protein
VTVDADGYQEVRPRNGAPATLSNFGARKAGLTQRERKALPRLQNMFSILEGIDGVSADIPYTIGTDCNSIRYVSASASGSGSSSTSPAASSSTLRSSEPPAKPHVSTINTLSITYWPELCTDVVHGGMRVGVLAATWQ